LPNEVARRASELRLLVLHAKLQTQTSHLSLTDSHTCDIVSRPAQLCHILTEQK